MPDDPHVQMVLGRVQAEALRELAANLSAILALLEPSLRVAEDRTRPPKDRAAAVRHIREKIALLAKEVPPVLEGYAQAIDRRVAQLSGGIAHL